MLAHPYRSLLASAAVLAVALAPTVAGPLEPSVGPVAPTGKPLPEVEPRIAISQANTPGDATSVYRITQPGSYYLTGNVQGAAGKAGIVITANGVTLDLNGFDMFGGVGSLDGISVTVNDLTAITVMNGSVRSWAGDGVDLQTANANNSRIVGVKSSANVGAGVACGTGSIITGCSAYSNGQAGITASGACLVNECTSYSNYGTGIIASTGCTVERCTSYFNDLAGISVNTGATVIDCTCRLNTTDGILATSACVIRNNTCTNNGFNTGDGAGVHTTGSDNRIDGNTCTGADRGVDVDGTGSLIVRNICSGNTNNWTIASSNAIGPIVTAGTTASTITGNGTAASTLGTTDPYANLNY